jgi:hypothetical protein
MAVVNTKAAPITNMDSSPVVLNNSNVDRGQPREAVGIVEAVSGDSIASVYRYCRIPSNCRVSRVLLSCDAITTCAADVGIYQTAQNGGAVVDADFFASAQSLAAAVVNLDVTHEADPADAGAGYGLADVEKPLWQALGLSADPMIHYDVCATLTAAAGSAGTTNLKVQWVE